MPAVQLRPGINICLTTYDPCLHIIAWQCNDAFVSWSIKSVPSNLTQHIFIGQDIFVFPYLCGSA